MAAHNKRIRAVQAKGAPADSKQAAANTKGKRRDIAKAQLACGDQIRSISIQHHWIPRGFANNTRLKPANSQRIAQLSRLGAIGSNLLLSSQH